MSEIERIVDQLERAHNGKAWHGPGLLELLAGVDETTARARPLPRAHSIEEIVLHVIAWQEEGLRRLNGQGSVLPPEQDWPSAMAWSDVLARLQAAFDALVTRVRQLEHSDLDKVVPGQSHDLYGLLHGIVQHNLYHAGQVALLKKS